MRPFVFSRWHYIEVMSRSIISLPRDALGTHHPPHAAPRIACLVPSITETLFALGLGDNVVARTGFCIHPEPQVRVVPKVGGTKDVNIAKLVEIEPTHVIVNIDENRKPDVDKIRRSIPNVIVTHPMSPEDNVLLFQLIGYVFYRRDRADELSRAFIHAMRDARETGARLAPETVLYLIWKKPWMTVSRDTYVSQMLATVGWKTQPIQAEKRYPEISDDDSVWQDVDRVLLSSEPYLFDDSHVDELNRRQPLRRSAELINGEYPSWYGYRAIDGLRYLSRLRTALEKS